MKILYLEIRRSKAKGYYYDIQGEKPCVVKGSKAQVLSYAKMHEFRVFYI